MTTTATPSIAQTAEFWRIARRLYTVYVELDRTFELGMPTCIELDSSADSAVPEAMERVSRWFEQIDQRVQVWQLRQLLQSTNLQNEETCATWSRAISRKSRRLRPTKTRSIFCWCNTSRTARPMG